MPQTSETRRRKTVPASFVMEFPAAKPPAARRHFAARLSVETDPWDVHMDARNGRKDFVILDTRGPEAFAKEHIQGAIPLFHRTITRAGTAHLRNYKLLVIYCAGPGCNASMKAAVKLAALGFRFKEMIGGLEYWKRSGYPTSKGLS